MFNLCVTLSVSSILSTGCAFLNAREARYESLKNEMKDYEYNRNLAAIWPLMLHFFAQQNYPLEGNDRKITGQEGHGFVRGIFSRSSETKEIGDGQRAMETDWKGPNRYRVVGTETGSNRCKIHIFLIVQDHGQANRERIENRDFEIEMALRDRIQPEEFEDKANSESEENDLNIDDKKVDTELMESEDDSNVVDSGAAKTNTLDSDSTNGESNKDQNSPEQDKTEINTPLDDNNQTLTTKNPEKDAVNAATETPEGQSN
ncbi:MAG: hypothetical protein JW841_02655 [Deltaproteobacteria bacterium]|nr:hypothetical protein [Deltaproteobacteria bacterium]